MLYSIFDIETDRLLETVTKIHCLSYKIVDENMREYASGVLTDYGDIRSFVLQQEYLLGHNIIRYDVPVLEKILGITITAKLIDTLALSWYLYPMQVKHGLKYWGEQLGVPKPVINDWQNLSTDDYVHRCNSDVEINTLLWKKQLAYLLEVYCNVLRDVHNLIFYLGFKLDCAREQEEVGCKIDREVVENSLSELYNLKQEKEAALIEAMPRNIKYKEVTIPSKMYKKDGDLSVRGEKWLTLLDEHNFSSDYTGSVMVKVLDEPGNPSSSSQVKDWLYSLGWEPTTFEYRKNTVGEVKQVPQVYVDDEVCESIKRLYEIEPALENLDMLSLIKHRIGIFEGYKDSIDDNGFTMAKVHGFTNTLRFRHMKPIVNLPKVFKFYGEQIRGAIIAPDDEHLLCGSDMSSLEDTTKQHYMYFFDPDYVTQMRVPGFDPHLDIAVLAGMLTEEQSEEHKNKIVDHSQVRGKAKVVNFAGVYGAGPPKIAQTSGMPLEQAIKLHRIYWQRNKAVKQVEASCIVKTVNDQMWLQNPVSKLWYTLRYMKDRFSTLNQGTGVYCFDLWVREVRARGIKIILQYHDEIVFSYPKGMEDSINQILQDAIKTVNDKVKLNVPLGVSVEFGENYAKIH